MLATPERIPGHGRTPDRTVWHMPAAGHLCSGACDWHPIACNNDEGIAVPAPNRTVPIDLTDRPDEEWCTACSVLIRDAGEPEVNSTP